MNGHCAWSNSVRFDRSRDEFRSDLRVSAPNQSPADDHAAKKCRASPEAHTTRHDGDRGVWLCPTTSTDSAPSRATLVLRTPDAELDVGDHGPRHSDAAADTSCSRSRDTDLRRAESLQLDPAIVRRTVGYAATLIPLPARPRSGDERRFEVRRKHRRPLASVRVSLARYQVRNTQDASNTRGITCGKPQSIVVAGLAALGVHPKEPRRLFLDFTD